MDISKFIENLVLIVGETFFYLYNEKSKDPIFVSPFLKDSKFTCGKFSSSRPSVIFIGREDGTLDIWDFAD